MSCEIAAAAAARLFSLKLHKYLSVTHNKAQKWLRNSCPGLEWERQQLTAGTGWVKAGISSVMSNSRQTRLLNCSERLF